MLLLIDEIDKADPEFEAFLLEVLSDFAVTVPEIGTFRAKQLPRVVLTSNNARGVNELMMRTLDAVQHQPFSLTSLMRSREFTDVVYNWRVVPRR